MPPPVILQAPGGGGGGLADIVDDLTPQLGGPLDANGKQVQWSKGADVASATGGAALALLADGNYFDITGTTTITSFNTTGGAGTFVVLHFDGALTLTHHATNLILPGAANILTAAGDEAIFVEYDTGKYRCILYTPAANIPGGFLVHPPLLTHIRSPSAGDIELVRTSGVKFKATQVWGNFKDGACVVNVYKRARGSSLYTIGTSILSGDLTLTSAGATGTLSGANNIAADDVLQIKIISATASEICVIIKTEPDPTT